MPSRAFRWWARSWPPAAQFSKFSTFLGFVAVTAATINVVGGFMITDRMLKMFKRHDQK